MSSRMMACALRRLGRMTDSANAGTSRRAICKVKEAGQKQIEKDKEDKQRTHHTVRLRVISSLAEVGDGLLGLVHAVVKEDTSSLSIPCSRRKVV